ncbi:MAG: phosphotransferase family protein [Cyclobacteriaceae bacterium]|nr:phosphotransferase family protein [Cyclobacteriaceae bacterium]
MEIDQPRETRKGEELDLDKLNRYLTGFPEVGHVIAQRQFPGGYSNLTYLLETTRGEVILRRPPFGAAIKSAHDMGREFRVLTLLRPHYSRVPKPILYCEDAEVLGAPFYLMERIKGIILRPSLLKQMQFSLNDMRQLSESLVDNLVQLHSIDIQSSGLVQLGKPEGYISRQVEGWTKRYVAAQTDTITEMEDLSRWLIASQPPDGPPAFLHNDYKYDNIVFREGHLPEIAGVLDWEMSTVGDPWMDLGATLAYWCEAGDGELAKVFNISWVPGNLTRQEVVERYTAQGGRPVESPVFYYVFGLFKNAVIAQQIYARWKQGHSKDPRFGQLIHVIRDLGHRGANALERGTV